MMSGVFWDHFPRQRPGCCCCCALWRRRRIGAVFFPPPPHFPYFYFFLYRLLFLLAAAHFFLFPLLLLVLLPRPLRPSSAPPFSSSRSGLALWARSAGVCRDRKQGLRGRRRRRRRRDFLAPRCALHCPHRPRPRCPRLRYPRPRCPRIGRKKRTGVQDAECV